ncbi:MAG: PHB depolymerase family esterase [Gemmatimonadaceae bacterium]
MTLPAMVAAVQAVDFHVRDRHDSFITVAGERRGYVFHRPPALDTARRAPLVIVLHGGALWGAAMRDITGWNALADREGFLVAYPSGQGWWPRSWPAWHGDDRAPDVEFIERLIDTLVARHGADRDRVYVNGLSNGGGMSFALSCDIPERIAAIGVVSGALPAWTGCTTRVPMPVMVIHGTADPTAFYHGGTSWVVHHPFPPVTSWVAQWGERNRCSGARDTVMEPRVSVRTYTGCADGAEVRLITLHGDGHVWPGGALIPEWFAGTDSRALDATAELWRFFRDK